MEHEPKPHVASYTDGPRTGLGARRVRRRRRGLYVSPVGPGLPPTRVSENHPSRSPPRPPGLPPRRVSGRVKPCPRRTLAPESPQQQAWHLVTQKGHRGFQGGSAIHPSSGPATFPWSVRFLEFATGLAPCDHEGHRGFQGGSRIHPSSGPEKQRPEPEVQSPFVF